MNSQTAFGRIEQAGVVSVMRGDFPPKVALHVAGLLMDAGLTCFELTMNSEQPLEAMQAIKREYGDDALVGMGTILTADQTKRALDAGADFIVSPAFQPEVVTTAMEANCLTAPAVTTTTEAVNAWAMGVKLLKLFPVGVLGVDYFKAIKGPLDHMRFICNGAINATNTQDFIKAGAMGVGVAGWLTGDGKPHEDALIKQRATAMVQAVEYARTGQKPMREI